MRALRIAIISVAAIAAIVLLWFLWVIAGSQPSNAEKQISIQPGSGIDGIATVLEQQNTIRSKWGFILYATVTGQSNDLQAGDYYLEGSTAQIVAQIADGRVDVREETVTIIEGLNRFQIQEELRTHSLDADGFVSAVTAGEADLSATLLDGKPADSTLEGYLYPDTYNFFRDETGDEMISKMVNNFEDKLTPAIREQIEASEFTFFEILTLASIVEKEVSRAEDKPYVAAVFIQRTKDDYLLQSDATLNYITGKSTIRPNADDLAQESLYNTYKYIGLPPGPISNPSIDSIVAVLNPAETDAYFFLATPDGDTLYSVTYEEHLQKRYDTYGY